MLSSSLNSSSSRSSEPASLLSFTRLSLLFSLLCCMAFRFSSSIFSNSSRSSSPESTSSFFGAKMSDGLSFEAVSACSPSELSESELELFSGSCSGAILILFAALSAFYALSYFLNALLFLSLRPSSISFACSLL